ncbi:MAG TPA: sugar ABC transporter substrate-binding protein [Symbiobacteriaceae bacterium]|nr:sugar ABC transporter substrate-binding protein [Symbiobacteriaceae bacterium]
MRSKRFVISLIAIAMVLTSLLGCSRQKESTDNASTVTTTEGAGKALVQDQGAGGPQRTGKEVPPTKKKGPIKVGFVPTAMNTHYDIVIAGAKERIDELGGSAIIDFVIQAPSGQSATAEQVTIVENWVEKGIDAIAVATFDDPALTPVFERAAKKGIPVFEFNMPLQMSTNPYFITNVGYDQRAAGVLVGKWVVEHYPNGAKVAVLEGLPGVHNDERYAGFKEGIKGHDNIKIVASQPADWVRSKGQTVMENILTAHPDVQVVFGLYDEMALGALATIRAHNLVGKVAVLGWDNTPDAFEAIKRREMTATVDSAPKQMGRDLIDAIKKYMIDGEMVPKVINADVKMYDQSNIDTINPDQHYRYTGKK